MRQIAFLSLYILLIALFGSSKSEEEKPNLYISAGCVVDGINDAHFLLGYDNSAIRDEFSGTAASFATQNIYGVDVSGTNYFNATLESGNLRIFTTDAYKNIEPEIGYVALARVRYQLNFHCARGNISLIFNQPLTDINNHDPYFEEESYEYIYVNNSIPSLYILTDDQPLSAIDIDMTNSRVTFSLEENDYFNVGQASTNTATRQTFARLNTLREIEAPFSIKLNLTATDMREPTRSATTTLEVIILRESEGDIPTPIFSNDSYTATYKNGELIFDQKIRLVDGIGYLANITQIGYEDYFSVSFANRAEGILQVDLLQPLSSLLQTEDNDIIQFEIQVFNNGSSEPAVATITVDIPRDEQDSSDEIVTCLDRPTLSKYSYVAEYSNGILNFNEKIRITSDNYSNLTVTQNDWSNYFRPALMGNEIIITTVEPLPNQILADNSFILFEIKVTKNYNASCSSGAAILIQLPTSVEEDANFSFQRNTYVALYNGDQGLTFQQQILLSGNVGTVRVQNSNFTDYFYVRSPASDNKLVTVDLIKPLERNNFDNGIILFDLVALSTDTSKSASATVVVVWDGSSTALIIFRDYPLTYIYVVISLVIIVAICAAIGLKFFLQKKRALSPSPSPSQLPPPYSPPSENNFEKI